MELAPGHLAGKMVVVLVAFALWTRYSGYVASAHSTRLQLSCAAQPSSSPF